MMNLCEQTENKFIELFGVEPQLFKAPGRINLIGEHTDYNDGFVLPAAIDKAIVFAMQKNEGNLFRFYSIDYQEYVEFEKVELLEDAPFWSRYLLGVLAQMQKRNLHFEGVDCVFSGDIPLGAGLSSSAALESGFAFGVNALFDFQLESIDLVKIAQKAEHEYAGVKCGIMDQYASVFGRKKQVVQLDCRSNTHQYFPLELKEDIFLLVNTKVKHSLASSAYNKRREECDTAVEYFRKYYPNVTALRDVTDQMLNEHIGKPDALSFQRALFVVNENDRVVKATQALLEDDLQYFGELMYASHQGLKELYEVSCDELDFLVKETKKIPEIKGSRMMGGGFGGCTLNLMKESFVEDFKSQITIKYFDRFGIKPEFYLVNIQNGVESIKTC